MLWDEHDSPAFTNVHRQTMPMERIDPMGPPNLFTVVTKL